MNTKKGFGLLTILIIVAIGSFLYFAKDKDGKRYWDKIISYYPDKKKEVEAKVGDLKKTVDQHDKEIESYLKK